MGTFNSRSFAQRGFPTFAAAGTATGLTSNTIYHVGGKTTVGDTYAGLFTYVPDDSTAASDDVIVVTGGRLKRQSFDSIVQDSPLPIEGQVALPSDVVNAIGSAVNAAIRGGGALPVPAGPPTNPINVTITSTWAAIPSIACKSFELLNERWPTDEVPIRYRRVGSTGVRTVPGGMASDPIVTVANANEYEASRADGVATNLVIQLQVLS